MSDTSLSRPPKVRKDDPKSYEELYAYMLRQNEELKKELDAIKTRLANGGL